MAHPLVRARVNLRVTGDEGTWPTQWLRRALEDSAPLGECVSIGCGAGVFELDLVRQGIVRRIVGVDIVDEPLAYACRQRDEAGISSDQLEYVKADARSFLSSQASLDAVFCQASLHHFDRLDELLARISAALRPGGLLYVDDYVGPAMREWNWWRLLLPNVVHNLLPWSVRRVGLIRAPRNSEDPTEMICASEITSAIRKHFEIETRRDYGGNLLAPIYPNLRRPVNGSPRPPSDEDFDRAVRFLLTVEDWLLRYGQGLGVRSHHSIFVARRAVA